MIENYVEIKLNPCRKDLTGMKFGKLTVIKPVKTKNSKYSQWLCKCECGNEVIVYSYKLLAGRVKSCGCLRTNIHPYKAMQQENAELKAENEKLTSWLASSEKQKTELCNVIHKKKEQIQTMKYMLFDEKEIPKDKFTMYYRIAQNERRTKSHRDLCTNIVKKYRQTLQEIKDIAENCYDPADKENDGFYTILQLITKAESEEV